MKTKIRELSTKELKEAFGDLDSEAIKAFTDEKNNAEFDLQIEKRIQQELGAIRLNTIAADAATVSSVPESIQATIDKARNEAFAENQKEEVALDAKIAAAKPNTSKDKTSWLTRFFGASSFGFRAGAAAALVICAFFILNKNGTPDIGGAVVLTPGPETGFADPLFVWKTESEVTSQVSLEIIDTKTGETLATSTGVKSPIAFSSFAEGKLLPQGSSFRLRITDREKNKTLAEQTFLTTKFAVARSPEREKTLDGVIRQCQGFIAAGRPADAWMLWDQLTTAEKAAPKMQELKKEILKLIG